MPCRVELSEAELEAERQARSNREIAKALKPVQDRNDNLTHENDLLRETILNIVNVLGAEAESLIPAGILENIVLDQVEHRKEDLRRLEKHFTKYLEESVKTQGLAHAVLTRDFQDCTKLLAKVNQADPKLPLEPQLGFDPDKY